MVAHQTISEIAYAMEEKLWQQVEEACVTCKYFCPERTTCELLCSDFSFTGSCTPITNCTSWEAM
jgi:hypothetical protein